MFFNIWGDLAHGGILDEEVAVHTETLKHLSDGRKLSCVQPGLANFKGAWNLRRRNMSLGWCYFKGL
jgi:hypothetical protein